MQYRVVYHHHKYWKHFEIQEIPAKGRKKFKTLGYVYQYDPYSKRNLHQQYLSFHGYRFEDFLRMGTGTFDLVLPKPASEPGQEVVPDRDGSVREAKDGREYLSMQVPLRYLAEHFEVAPGGDPDGPIIALLEPEQINRLLLSEDRTVGGVDVVGEGKIRITGGSGHIDELIGRTAEKPLTGLERRQIQDSLVPIRLYFDNIQDYTFLTDCEIFVASDGRRFCAANIPFWEVRRNFDFGSPTESDSIVHAAVGVGNYRIGGQDPQTVSIDMVGGQRLPITRASHQLREAESIVTNETLSEELREAELDRMHVVMVFLDEIDVSSADVEKGVDQLGPALVTTVKEFHEQGMEVATPIIYGAGPNEPTSIPQDTAIQGEGGIALLPRRVTIKPAVALDKLADTLWNCRDCHLYNQWRLSQSSRDTFVTEMARGIALVGPENHGLLRAAYIAAWRWIRFEEGSYLQPLAVLDGPLTPALRGGRVGPSLFVLEVGNAIAVRTVADGLDRPDEAHWGAVHTIVCELMERQDVNFSAAKRKIMIEEFEKWFAAVGRAKSPAEGFLGRLEAPKGDLAPIFPEIEQGDEAIACPGFREGDPLMGDDDPSGRVHASQEPHRVEPKGDVDPLPWLARRIRPAPDEFASIGLRVPSLHRSGGWPPHWRSGVGKSEGAAP